MRCHAKAVIYGVYGGCRAYLLVSLSNLSLQRLHLRSSGYKLRIGVLKLSHFIGVFIDHRLQSLNCALMFIDAMARSCQRRSLLLQSDAGTQPRLVRACTEQKWSDEVCKRVFVHRGESPIREIVPPTCEFHRAATLGRHPRWHSVRCELTTGSC